MRRGARARTRLTRLGAALSFAALLIGRAFAASAIAAYADAGCQTLASTWSGPNGYPDGDCTEIQQRAGERFGSFQIQARDNGCGVTIYGNGTADMCDPAATPSPIIAQLRVCYNASWAYYSIDECTPASHTGAIVGGVVGGVVGLAAVVGALLWLFWLRPRQRRARTQPAAASGQQRAAGQQETDPGLPTLELPGEDIQEVAGESAKCEMADEQKHELAGEPKYEMAAEQMHALAGHEAKAELPGS